MLIGLGWGSVLFAHFQERLNASSAPGALKTAAVILQKGKSPADMDAAIKKELQAEYGDDAPTRIRPTTWLPFFCSLLMMSFKWVPLLFYSITVMMAQNYYQVNVTACHPKLWFTIVTFCIFFGCDLFYGFLFLSRFTKSACKLRRALVFESLFLLFQVAIPFETMAWMTFALGYTVHIVTTGC